MQGLTGRYEDEITALLEETTHRMNLFKDRIHEQQECELVQDALQKLNHQHQLEREQFIERFQKYKSDCEARLAEIKRASRARVDKISDDVRKAKDAVIAKQDKAQELERELARLQESRAGSDADHEAELRRVMDESRAELERKGAVFTEEMRAARTEAEGQLKSLRDELLGQVNAAESRENDAKTELSAANDRNAQLTEELAHERESRALLQARYDKEVVALSGLRLQHSAADGEAARLRDEVARLTQANEELEKMIRDRGDEYAVKIAGFEAQNKRMTGDLRNSAEMMISKNKEIAQLEDELEQVKLSLEESEKRESSLAAELEQEKEKAAALASEGSASDELVSQVKAELDNVRRQLDETRERLQATTVSRDKFEAKAVELAEQLADSKEGQTRTDTDLATERATVAQLQAKVEQLDTELADSKAEAVDWAKKAVDLGDNITALKEKLALEREETDALRARIAQTVQTGDARASDAVKRAEALAAQVDRLGVELREAQEATAAAEERVTAIEAEKEAEIAQIRQEMDQAAKDAASAAEKAESTIEGLTEDNTALKTDLESTTARMAELQDRVSSMADSTDSQVTGLEERVQTLLAELDSKHSQLELSLAANGKADRELASLRDTVAAQDERIAEEQATVGKLRAALEEAKAARASDLEALREEMADALDEKDRVHEEKLKAALKANDASAGEWQTRVDELEEKLKMMGQAAQEAATAAKVSMNETMDQHEAAVARLEKDHRAALDKLEADLAADKEAALNRLGAEHAAGVEQVMATMRAQQEEAAAKVRGLQQVIAQAEATVESRDRDLLGLQERFDSLMQSHDALVVTLDDAKKRIAQTAADGDATLKEERVLFQQRLADELRRAQEEIEVARSEKDAEIDRLTTDMENLRYDLESRYEELLAQYESERRDFDSRPPRQEDLEAIAELEQMAAEQQQVMGRLRREIEYYKRELVNREESYNKTFSRTPNVGVIDPLGRSKPGSGSAGQLPPLNLGGKTTGGSQRIGSARRGR
ncbi:Chromosome partition protein Smc [Carpediemonas membranifera]|uniref:Chromosome partition protein Smc n=1 Tax=Carpediemonas membranifera TaxID=201153 RepID=A0A8J6AX55_9EUKA|nr:Chromosome partition protein Smc [Carpediemonas membranifera]|eukprot:KAG9393735.1 Chromosome partition protein Smc [Carpediemonas membranifera]